MRRGSIRVLMIVRQKCKKLMTKECAKINSLTIDFAIMMAFKGSITTIYKPTDGEKELLDAEQNSSKSRMLLLAKIIEGKALELT